MPLIVNGTEIEHVIFKALGIDQEVDYVKVSDSIVFESTKFVDKPVLSGTLTYNGSVQSPTIIPATSEGWTVVPESVTSATNAGTYTITYRLNEGYAWTDKTTDDVVITWTIARASVAIPTVTANLTYNGQTQRPTITPASSAGWSIVNGSVTSATNGGTYTITFRVGANYQWSNGTTADVQRTWTIKRQSLAIPYITTKNVAYIGSAVSPTVANYNSSLMNASGNTSYNGIASNLAIKWNLRNTTNYQWSDGTITQKSDTWSTYAGTITWYINNRSGGGRGVYTFKTTYGVNFYNLAGTWDYSNTSTDEGRIQIVQGVTYAACVQYVSGTSLGQDAIRDSGGTQYAKTAIPVNGGTYYS